MAEPTTTPPAAPQPVTLKIDGETIVVAKGTNVLEAARAADIDISHFCYHAGLSSPAVCRQCLVEVKGAPKLVPSCYTPVAENMEVFTKTDKVLVARAQMLEFTLVNHPVDCPICDKAGECTLQQLYHRWDHAHSRVDVSKVHKPKKVDLGPEIVLDAERCILCTRCIRVCDEVAGSHQLEMTFRGDRQILDVAPGQKLDNPYSLNTVDVCPVGALTSKDFRFTMRAWELYKTDSICPGCATGCNIEIHHAQGDAWRLVPRLNPDVNKYWMCDEGRFTYKEVSHGSRIVGCTLGGDPAPIERAAAFAAERIAAAHAAGTLGVVFGARATNEDLYLLSRVINALGGAPSYVAGRAPVMEREDRILRSSDINPNTAGALLFSGAAAGDLVKSLAALDVAVAGGTLSALWIVGEDVPLSSQAATARFGALDLIVQATHAGALTEMAKVVLPAAAWAEVDGTYLSRPKDGKPRVQRIRRALEPRGGSRPHWELILAIARRLATTLDDIKAREMIAATDFGGPSRETARGLFNKMKADVPAMAGADWGPPAPLVQLRFAGSRG